MPRSTAPPPAYTEAGPSRHPGALSFEPPSPASPPDLAPATQALIALTQDVSALLSLSIEATASLVHDWLRASLCRIGIGNSVPPTRRRDQKYGKGEVGRGLAVVVIGAAEHTGQSLSLQLARSGYTVFPFLPLPSPLASPADSPLSSLLLAWSNVQRRLRQRYPNHPGSIVPIITDPEPNSPQWVKQLKGKDRFRHAGDTVRAYLRDSGLDLVAVLCATQVDPSMSSADGGKEDVRVWPHQLEQYGSPETDTLSLSMIPSPIPPSPPSLPSVDRDMLESLTPPELERGDRHVQLPIMPISGRGLLSADESALLGLYRANVLDPLTAVRELRDMLIDPGFGAGGVANPRGKGRNPRLVFVNAQSLASGSDRGHDRGQGVDETVLRVITAARSEVISLLRDDLAESGVEVCEVVAGPLNHTTRKRLTHTRSISDESGSTSMSGRPVLSSTVQVANQLVRMHNTGEMTGQAEEPDARATLEDRLQTLNRLWAVDDALLYSSVRRAMEDQYPRQRHHAGLSPLVESIVDLIPGARLGKTLGRWVLGRLLMPRRGT